jgi:hypothetical protein
MRTQPTKSLQKVPGFGKDGAEQAEGAETHSTRRSQKPQRLIVGSACFAGSAFDPSSGSSAEHGGKDGQSRQRAQRLIQRGDRRNRKG